MDQIFTKKNIITYLILAIIILAIPLSVRLTQERTRQLQVQAAGGDIKFPKTETQECKGNDCTTTSATVKLEIKAPDF